MNRLFRCAAACAALVIPVLLALAPSPPTDASGAETPPIVQSPPVFAVRGSRVAVTATPSGHPAAVTLVAGGRRRRMSAKADAWTSSFRARGDRVRYHVETRYANGARIRSAAFDLAVLRSITTPHVAAATSAPVRMLTLDIGRDVAVSGGSQAARILPASFDVDEATGRIDVLDEVNARVLTYDAAGKRVAATPIATRSTTVDDIVREPDGTRVLFDATRGQITHLTAHGQETVAADFADAPANARLATDGDAVFVRDAADGSLRSVAGARRHDGVRAVLDRGSVLVAPIGGRGVRVDLGRPALDVVGSETDGTDVLWALVDLDDGTMRLVSVDLGHPDVVTARVVDASVFGDVTRRLVALDSGAAVMSATATDVSFTRYAR